MLLVYRHIYIYGGACGVMVITVLNVHYDPNPE